MSQAVSATATKARRPRPHWLAPAAIWVAGSLWILAIVQWENQFLMEYPLAQSLDNLFSGASFQLLVATTILILLARVVSQGNHRIFIRYGWFAVFWTLTAIPVILSNRHWPLEEMVPIHSEADRLRALIDIPVFVLMFFAAFTVANWIGASLRKHRSPEVKS